MILPPLEADELLDAIDSEWRDHFSCRAAAEQFYADELPPRPRIGKVIHSSRFEPDTVVDDRRDDLGDERE